MSGVRLARAAYIAAVKPAQPLPTMMTFSIRRNLARGGRGETAGSAGCQPAVAGSLPASLVRHNLRYSTRVSAGCRDLQAGSLCSPELARSPFQYRFGTFT